MNGFATEAGTNGYRRRLGKRADKAHFKTWKGLRLSSVGIGTYLGAEDDATDRAYEASVTRALELGINVIDTAVNYRHQRSERSVGAALRALVAAGGIAREEVVLATKGGFIPFDGEVPANPGAYYTETYIRPGVLTAADVVGGCHCITPRYLADQLERSRANLGVDTIDVYYLHNPEMQLEEVPREHRHFRTHEFHYTRMHPGEAELIDADLIRATCLVGTAEELIEQIQELERQGLQELMFATGVDAKWRFAEEFSRRVMARV